MTAQPNNEDHAADKVNDQSDPIGPITFSKRTRIGARAFALVGAASAFAVGVIEITDGCSTFTTINHTQ